jgi:hypothetical protein
LYFLTLEVLVCQFLTTFLGVQLEDNPPGNHFSLASSSNSSILAGVTSEACSMEIFERPDPPVKEDTSLPARTWLWIKINLIHLRTQTPKAALPLLPSRLHFQTTVLPQVLKASANEAVLYTTPHSSTKYCSTGKFPPKPAL